MSDVDGRYMSKVYLTQARATKWPEWRSTLVKWARRNLHEWLRENKAALQAARIVTFNDDTDGIPFINKSRLSMLHTGAIRQLSDRLQAALLRLELAERKLALIS